MAVCANRNGRNECLKPGAQGVWSYQRKLWFICGHKSPEPSPGCPRATISVGLGCAEMSQVSGGMSPAC